MKSEQGKEAQKLVEWFQENSRPLPWRKSKNPYAIWISEIMLQQTTVKAVIPFYERFMGRFPNVEGLAAASIEEVYEVWAGLGYYSRARNLHKAARELLKRSSFPKSHQELLKLSGFGDYTARAVSSQAFEEPVGVVDGNVIRVLSRRMGIPYQHWKSTDKRQLQELADQYAQGAQPSQINQALMELGATLCTPQNPTCLLCPLKKSCVALKEDKILELPLKKPKKENEIWLWEATVVEQKGRIAFIANEYAPFLKKQLILPGKASKRKSVPKNFDFQHAITHHKIYVHIQEMQESQLPKDLKLVWIPRKKIKEKIPFSLIHKSVDWTGEK